MRNFVQNCTRSRKSAEVESLWNQQKRCLYDVPFAHNLPERLSLYMSYAIKRAQFPIMELAWWNETQIFLTMLNFIIWMCRLCAIFNVRLNITIFLFTSSIKCKYRTLVQCIRRCVTLSIVWEKQERKDVTNIEGKANTRKWYQSIKCTKNMTL